MERVSQEDWMKRGSVKNLSGESMNKTGIWVKIYYLGRNLYEKLKGCGYE